MLSLLLGCIVRSSLIALSTGFVLAILRVKSARVRHTAWASVVVFMLALPVWSVVGPKAVVRVFELGPAAVAVAAAADVSVMTGGVAIHPAAQRFWSAERIFIAVYLLGLIALLARLAIGTVRMESLRRLGRLVDGKLTSDACAAPITVGWLKPSVILPVRWPNWSGDHLNAALEHEREHARWRDPLVRWLALVNRAVFWFHPLAWWLERRLTTLAEEACDAAVLAHGHDPLEYTDYLLETARAMQRAGARVHAAGMAMAGGSLPGRIQRIVDAAPVPRTSRGTIVCAGAACMMMSGLFLASAVNYERMPINVRQPVVASVSDSVKVWEPAVSHFRSTQPVLLLSQARPTGQRAPVASGSGSISGTVEDPSGARIVRCTITARNQIDSSVVTAVSDAAGTYRLYLAAGDYMLDYSAPGFVNTAVHVQVEEGKPVRVDAMLDLGKVNEHVTVTRPRPAVQAPSTVQPATPTRIKVGGDVQPVQLISKTPPIYPADLEQQGVEGVVLIRAVISNQGVPLSPHVLNTDVDQRFIQAALDSIRQWRYQPAMLNGEPVETATTITVEFRLEK